MPLPIVHYSLLSFQVVFSFLLMRFSAFLCHLGFYCWFSMLLTLCMVDMECVVQGIIETQHVEALEILLQGLCGVQRERLRIHEICLKSGPHLGTVASEVRLLCDLEQAEPSWWCNEGSRRRANFCSG
ncbi:hypothetical protein GLYMA_18G135700v4 [Glycine max]|nr:hypothetical protein GLYMA_18G135700v4 [Glycine max]KAH1154394.1 hypothetical protein GYH30_049897 [Glycine max]